MTASWKAFATVDPFDGMTADNPGILQDLAGGFWVDGAEHRDIRDADFARETANLTRSQILQQAGTAMLAQANQLPQNVLQLLG